MDILDNPYVKSTLIMFIMMYAVTIGPTLPKYIRNLFYNPIFRVAFCFLIVMRADKDPSFALVLSIAFILTLSSLTQQKAKEAFGNQQIKEPFGLGFIGREAANAAAAAAGREAAQAAASAAGREAAQAAVANASKEASKRAAREAAAAAAKQAAEAAATAVAKEAAQAAAVAAAKEAASVAAAAAAREAVASGASAAVKEATQAAATAAAKEAAEAATTAAAKKAAKETSEALAREVATASAASAASVAAKEAVGATAAAAAKESLGAGASAASKEAAGAAASAAAKESFASSALEQVDDALLKGLKSANKGVADNATKIIKDAAELAVNFVKNHPILVAAGLTAAGIGIYAAIKGISFGEAIEELGKKAIDELIPIVDGIIELGKEIIEKVIVPLGEDIIQGATDTFGYAFNKFLEGLGIDGSILLYIGIGLGSLVLLYIIYKIASNMKNNYD